MEADTAGEVQPSAASSSPAAVTAEDLPQEGLDIAAPAEEPSGTPATPPPPAEPLSPPPVSPNIDPDLWKSLTSPEDPQADVEDDVAVEDVGSPVLGALEESSQSPPDPPPKPEEAEAEVEEAPSPATPAPPAADVDADVDAEPAPPSQLAQLLEFAEFSSDTPGEAPVEAAPESLPPSAEMEAEMEAERWSRAESTVEPAGMPPPPDPAGEAPTEDTGLVTPGMPAESVPASGGEGGDVLSATPGAEREPVYTSPAPKARSSRRYAKEPPSLGMGTRAAAVKALLQYRMLRKQLESGRFF